MVHKYSRAGLYTVTVECSTSEWHVAAQKSILIQEPLGEFGTVRCYSLNQSTNHTNCKALYNNPLNIEVQLDAGKIFFIDMQIYTINNKYKHFEILQRKPKIYIQTYLPPQEQTPPTEFNTDTPS